jgi:hypothetical protein
VAVVNAAPTSAVGPLATSTSSQQYVQQQQQHQEQNYIVGPAVQMMRPQQPLPRHGAATTAATATTLVGISGATSRSNSYADASNMPPSHAHKYHGGAAPSQHQHQFVSGSEILSQEQRFQSPSIVQIGTATPMTHRQLMATPTRHH